MSVVPLLVNELLSDVNRPIVYDQHFGQPVSVHHLPLDRLVSAPLRVGYLRPWRHISQDNSGISNVTNDKDGYKISLDVQDFKPEELTVKVVDDYICIEGKHEERTDEHGLISRHFTRRYKIPDNVNKQALASSLSSDGVLKLHAPKLANKEIKERNIPITLTNQPAVKSDEKKEAIKDEEKKKITSEVKITG